MTYTRPVPYLIIPPSGARIIKTAREYRLSDMKPFFLPDHISTPSARPHAPS